MLQRFVVVALLVLGARVAHAEPLWASGNYMAIGYAYTDPDTARGARYGNGFNGLYASRLGNTRWWEARVFATVLDTGATTAIDFYQTGFGLDLLQPLGSESGWHFFLLGGGGLVLNDVKPDTKDGKSYFLNGGVGWRALPWESWGIRPRLELRYIYDTFDSGMSDLQLGFKVEFGARTEHVVEKIVRIENVKTVEVPVEVEKPVEKATPCVASAAPAPQILEDVDEDADGDGVPDAKDTCPNTLKGAKVGPDGCVEKEQTVNLPSIEFEVNSTVLTAAGKQKLDPVVAFLSSQTQVQVEVLGHTDTSGTAKANQALSEGRAKSVMDYFVSRGVAAERVSSKGFGSTQPIATNKTKQGRAQNRRVELHISTKSS